MEQERRGSGFFKKLISYIVVAALSSLLTLFIFGSTQQTQSAKLQQLRGVIDQMYIGEVDEQVMEDLMAAGMVQSLGDQWSYYISADQYQDYQNNHKNSYVGIGVTVETAEKNGGFLVKQVEPGGPAKEAGIIPGDIVVAVGADRVSDIGVDVALERIAGEEGTFVTVTVLRDQQELTFTMERKSILTQVASGKMLTDTIGYIRIYNFNDRCASETLAIFADLEKQGAQAMIFDVRFNPGGYVHEMVKVLDYLLPEGVVFRSEDYRGRVSEETSGPECKNMPMAVLINNDSVSAAEFFAAALHEYDYAVTVGQATLGKGYFQQAIQLSDGSAVNLSVGKYYTRDGVNLAEVGGLQPDEPVEVDEETMALIYSESLEAEQDLQLQKAIEILMEKM